MSNGAFAICYTELIGVNLVYGTMAQLKMCMIHKQVFNIQQAESTIDISISQPQPCGAAGF